MEENGVLNSCSIITKDKSDNLCPMFFGVSCAFFALRLLSKPEMNDEKWSEIRNRLLQGSAQLLGLLVWRVQKVEANSAKCEILCKLANAERKIVELKGIRSEDAKANEKVVSIFAAQEQGWLSERKKLRQQLGTLLNHLRVLHTKREEAMSELNNKLKEKDLLLESKAGALVQEEAKRKELEEKLEAAKFVMEELRETAKRQAQQQSLELWKHKTAFIELVSNQRQLEAEMGRALKQVEAAKKELNSVLEQKEESISIAQKLSVELIKTQKDLEQKDKVLSAVLRKLKLDTEEKQVLLKEVKLSKAKKKQAEVETERWRAVSESRHERHSLRSMLTKHLVGYSDGRGVQSDAIVPSQGGRSKLLSTDLLLEYEQTEKQKEEAAFSPLYEYYLTKGREELVFAGDTNQLKGWIRSEAEKSTSFVEQRHVQEINAFADELRLKDEKLEAFRWRLLSIELESKRLQSHIEGLNRDLSQLRQENMKLDSLLLDREGKIKSLKQQIMILQLESPDHKKNDLSSFSPSLPLGHQSIWSKVKIIKRKPGDKEQETKATSVEISQVKPQNEEETPSTIQSNAIVLAHQSPENESKEEKGVVSDLVPTLAVPASPEEDEIVEKPASSGHCVSSNKIVDSMWKMDLHALGVSYKIKRIKQQLLLLERLTRKEEICEDGKGEDNVKGGAKGFDVLMLLLNKQVNRYQSLQGKTDELCQRMHYNNLDVSHGGCNAAKTKEETRTLEHFLEQTFQLQRYIVATGQKMMEIQSKMASGFVEAVEELEDGSASFDTNRFVDSVRTLFREVQRGLEVRIARIIGDLEGTLACDGIIHLR